nr:hypothetical protein [Tanacetum cinerariifolium]
MQTQTSNTLHNAIMEAGGKDRSLMLASDKDVSVVKGSTETTTERYMENYKNVSQDIRDQLNAKAEAVQIIPTGIDNDIYFTVDACPNACEMWKAIERLKQGESINVQDLETNLYWEFGKITSRDGESLESYYSRNKGKAIVNSPLPIYDQEPSMVVEDDEMSKEKEIDKLMALISLSFKKIYKPTNNNLRTSSNTSRANQDNSPRINRGTRYDNQRIINVVRARENVARECQKPKWAKDAAYHKEKMLLCKQEEAGFQLNAEQADWRDETDDESEDQELKAHYMYMAQIQEVTSDAVDDSGPIFDSDPLQKIDQDDDDDDDLANERDLLFSLIEKLKCEIDDIKNRNKFLETSNKVLVDKLKGEIEDFKNKNKSLESLNKHFKEANNELSKTNELMYKDLKKFQAELDRHKDVKYASKELFTHQETIFILSQEKEAQLKFYKTREDKKIDKVIVLENKIKDLDNIVYKTDQLVQTMNMLNRNCKTSFAKPKFLKKAQRRNPYLLSQISTRNSENTVLNEIGRLSREYYYADHMNAILGVYTELDEVTNLQCDYLEMLDKCECLEKELSKRVIPTTSVSRPQLKSNQKEDRVMLNNSQGKKQDVEDHPRNVKFSKNKTLVQRGLHAQVRIVRTDKGKEFLNKTLHAYFASEGIHHQTSVARTPKQNDVVKRRNRTLVEAARTMLSAAKVPLFFWAEAIATVCFTQNRSLVIPRHEKTPYHIINDQKPSIKFFYIFGSLCYIVRDGENLDKIKENGDACIFVGYSTQSRAYRVFNKRTRVIVETIHVNFDELPQMASDHVSSDPVPKCQRAALEHKSLSPGPQCQENVPQEDRIVTTSNELDLLFSLMIDELLNGSTQVVSKSFAVTTADAHNQCQQQFKTPLNTQTTPEPTCQVPSHAPTVTSTENINQAKSIIENAQVKNDGFINIFCTPVQDRGETSSHHVYSSHMHTFYQHHPSEHRWTKDHLLEQVNGNPSQLVRTRRQLESDGEMCMFALTVSRTEPKNIKEAMADSTWIESMQEELHQFDRLDVWELVDRPLCKKTSLTCSGSGKTNVMKKILSFETNLVLWLRDMLKRKELISKNHLHQLLG